MFEELTQDQKNELKGMLKGLIDSEVQKVSENLIKKHRAEYDDLRSMMGERRRGFDGPNITTDDKAGLEGLGRLIKAAYRHTKHGDPRGLEEFGGLDNVMVAKSEMSEGSGAAGGYFVPDDFETSVLRVAEESGLFMSRARKFSMSGKTMKVPSLDTPPSVAWHSEGEAMTESAPVLDEVELTSYRLDAYATISNELLEDSKVDITGWLAQEFTEAMAKEVDNQCLNGAGAPCSGILTAAAGQSLSLAAGNTAFTDIHPDDCQSAFPWGAFDPLPSGFPASASL